MTASPDNLAEAFFANTGPLRQAHIDWLVIRHGVPGMALACDGDGDGWLLATAKVERVGQRFHFRPEDGTGAFAIVARDDVGWGVDIVAWEPRAGWVAPWLGEVPALGLQDLLAQRNGGPLRVHRGVLEWLRDGRNGLVILAPADCRRLLGNLTVQADDVEHGTDLRRILTAPTPRIVVSASSNRKVV